MAFLQKGKCNSTEFMAEFTQNNSRSGHLGQFLIEKKTRRNLHVPKFFHCFFFKLEFNKDSKVIELIFFPEIAHRGHTQTM